MNIIEAVQKAIDNGYRPNHLGRIFGYSGGSAIISNNIFSDPLFWQSLGVALEWGEVCINCHNSVGYCCEGKYKQDWKWYWHKFIDMIANGAKPEAFFAKLGK